MSNMFIKYATKRSYELVASIALLCEIMFPSKLTAFGSSAKFSLCFHLTKQGLEKNETNF